MNDATVDVARRLAESGVYSLGDKRPQTTRCRHCRRSVRFGMFFGDYQLISLQYSQSSHQHFHGRLYRLTEINQMSELDQRWTSIIGIWRIKNSAIKIQVRKMGDQIYVIPFYFTGIIARVVTLKSEIVHCITIYAASRGNA